MKHFPPEAYQHWTARHRGPYALLVIRPSKGRTPVRSEWLPGEVPQWDVEEEAQALLTDKRDTILRVHVWSIREEQFVMTFARPQADAEGKKAA